MTGRVNATLLPEFGLTEVAVTLIPLETDAGGALLPLPKRVVQAADGVPTELVAVASPRAGAGGRASEFDYALETGAVTGDFAAVAFLRTPRSGDGWIDFVLPQIGFHAGEGCLVGTSSDDDICVDPVTIDAADAAVGGVDAAIRPLRAPAPPGRVVAPARAGATTRPGGAGARSGRIAASTPPTAASAASIVTGSTQMSSSELVPTRQPSPAWKPICGRTKSIQPSPDRGVRRKATAAKSPVTAPVSSA